MSRRTTGGGWGAVRARAAAAVALLAAAGVAGARPLVVGGDRDYPPYEFLDERGDPAGFNVDLTRAIAEVMGLEVEFRLGGWAEVRAGLRSGEIDALQGMSHSAARDREVDFSPPHTVVHHAVFARRGSPAVASLEDLRGREVVLHGGGIVDEMLAERAVGARVVRVATPADALRALAAGRHDYAVVAMVPGTFLLRKLRLTNVEMVTGHVAAVDYGYAVREGDAALLSRLSEGLAILKQTGRLEEIHARWLGVLEPPRATWRLFWRFGAIVFVPLAVGLLGALAWTRSLHHQVRARTASLRQEVAEREKAAEDLKRHQAQLVQADKLAALGILVSGVAHEVNNPNGLILLATPSVKAFVLDALALLDERWREEGDFEIAGVPYSRARAEIPRLLDQTQEGARRIKRIVEDLKDFARRRDAPRRERVDLNAVAQAGVRLVDAALRKATGRFSAEWAPGPLAVEGDAQRIEPGVVNLVLNACPALPDRSRAIAISTARDGGRALLRVRDEGAGVAPEHLPHLTDPFFTTKREAGGTGLGLAVSAGIVKEHGGTLSFDSAPGAGTTVTLALPAAPEATP